MAHEKGTCGPDRDSCLRNKRSCYHNITCTIVRQFQNGRWLIENQYHYVKAINSESMVFEDGEYQSYHNPNAAPQYPSAMIGIAERNEEDFNAKLVRLKKMKEIHDPTTTSNKNINGSATDVDHWSESEKAWHTEDCKIIAR